MAQQTFIGSSCRKRLLFKGIACKISNTKIIEVLIHITVSRTYTFFPPFVSFLLLSSVMGHNIGLCSKWLLNYERVVERCLNFNKPLSLRLATEVTEGRRKLRMQKIIGL